MLNNIEEDGLGVLQQYPTTLLFGQSATRLYEVLTGEKDKLNHSDHGTVILDNDNLARFLISSGSNVLVNEFLLKKLFSYLEDELGERIDYRVKILLLGASSITSVEISKILYNKFVSPRKDEVCKLAEENKKEIDKIKEELKASRKN